MPLVILLIMVSGIILSILIVAYGDTAANIANFAGAHIVDYLKAIPSAAKDGALFGILLGAIAAAAYVCIPFYFAQGNLFGIFVGAWKHNFILARDFVMSMAIFTIVI